MVSMMTWGMGTKRAIKARQLVVVAVVASCSALMLGCAAAPGPMPVISADRQLEDEDDLNIDVPKARQLIGRARVLLKDSKDFDGARAALRDADRFANETVREEIRRWSQEIDSVQANELIPAILIVAKAGKCLDAADGVLGAVAKHKSTTVARFVKDRSKAILLDCFLGILKVDQSIARETLSDPRVKQSLDSQSYETLRKKINQATVSQVVSKLKGPIEKRRWAKVMKRADELRAREEIGRAEMDRLLVLVRVGVAEDVLAKMESALDRTHGAANALKAVDKLIALARWGGGNDASVREVPVPDKVRTGREHLAFWAACGKVNCRLSETASLFTYGIVTVAPLLAPTSKGKRDMGHAVKVWRIADSPTHALVMRSKPPALDGIASRVKHGIGWIKASKLRSSDTSEWLPPGRAIVGARIWAPLRKGDKLELGTVRSAKGGKVTVERMSDRAMVTVRRGRVRFGTVKKGTKVYARCDHPLKHQLAVIDEVIPTSGDPVARYHCLSGGGEPESRARQDQLTSLRTTAQLLPRRR
jgi:hypothetical protein